MIIMMITRTKQEWKIVFIHKNIFYYFNFFYFKSLSLIKSLVNLLENVNVYLSKMESKLCNQENMLETKNITTLSINIDRLLLELDVLTFEN